WNQNDFATSLLITTTHAIQRRLVSQRDYPIFSESSPPMRGGEVWQCLEFVGPGLTKAGVLIHTKTTWFQQLTAIPRVLRSYLLLKNYHI
uniref:SNF2_N domain-containing protein n=1 Tax=Mesocestoides corti TaxID=53468 RepID=A0A5K3FXD6_MESCO